MRWFWARREALCLLCPCPVLPCVPLFIYASILPSCISSTARTRNYATVRIYSVKVSERNVCPSGNCTPDPSPRVCVQATGRGSTQHTKQLTEEEEAEQAEQRTWVRGTAHARPDAPRVRYRRTVPRVTPVAAG